MTDITGLLNEAKELGILNIDLNNKKLTPELLLIAVSATKRFNEELNDDDIARKIQGAMRLATTQQQQ